MEPKRFQLEGQSLAALQAQVASEHGPDARIIAAEKVTVGGIRGFLARQHVEVTVEVAPSAGAGAAGAASTRRGRRAHAQLDMPARLGIAALLAEAEETEARLQRTPAAAPVSTGSDDFAALMDDLTFNTVRALAAPVLLASATAAPGSAAPGSAARSSTAPGSAAPASTAPGSTAPVQISPASAAPEQPTRSTPPVRPAGVRPAATPASPRPLGGAGDLVVIIGLHGDALAVAISMATIATGDVDNPVEVVRAGALPGAEPGWDRRRALAARARGVERGQGLFVAFGLDAAPRSDDLTARVAAVRNLGADQVWVAVDAGRKPGDTAAWVNRIAAQLPVDALAVIGVDATASPETVDELGLPVGWVDGAPALARRPPRGPGAWPLRTSAIG